MPAVATVPATATPARPSGPVPTAIPAPSPAGASSLGPIDEERVAALQSQAGNAAVASLLEEEAGRDGRRQRATVIADALARQLLEPAAEAARAELLDYLRKGLGVGGTNFLRSKQVRAFRQKMKDAARQQAAADVAAIEAEAGPAARAYLEMIAAEKAYAASKESVDAALADQAEEWLQEEWPTPIDERMEYWLKRIVAPLVTILEPAPEDEQLVVAATAAATKLAREEARSRASDAKYNLRHRKNAMIKPVDIQQDSAEVATGRMKDIVAERTTSDGIGAKALETAIEASSAEAAMGKLGRLLDAAIPQAGDSVSLSVEIKIPIPESPAYVTIGLEGKAGRGITGFTTSGVATMDAPTRLEIMGEFTIGAGIGIALPGIELDASGSIGLFARAGSNDGTAATMKALSYGAYRTASARSKALGNWWADGSTASSGALDNRSKGREERAEMWAAMVEEQVFTKEGNAFADTGWSAAAAASAAVGPAAAGLGVSGRKISRYDREGLSEKLGPDFAAPVGDAQKAASRRAKAKPREVSSRGYDASVEADVCGETVAFAGSYSWEDTEGAPANENWGVEVSAAVTLGPGAATTLGRYAASIGAGAAGVLRKIHAWRQNQDKGDESGQHAGIADGILDAVSIVNGALDNEIATGLDKALTTTMPGDDEASGVFGASASVQVGFIIGQSSGNLVVRFEVREAKTLDVSVGLANAGIAVSASKGTYIFKHEYVEPAKKPPNLLLQFYTDSALGRPLEGYPDHFLNPFGIEEFDGEDP